MKTAIQLKASLTNFSDLVTRIIIIFFRLSASSFNSTTAALRAAAMLFTFSIVGALLEGFR